MGRIPFIRRIAFQHCTSTIESLGFDVDALLSRAGIPLWQYGEPLDLVPVRDFVRVLDIGAKTIGDSSFGLVVADRNPMNFGAFSGLIARSVSLFDACQNSARLINLLNSGSYIWVSVHPNFFRLCRSKPPGWQSEQYVLRHMVAVVRMATGREWRPKKVYLTASQTNNIEDTETFGDSSFRLQYPYLAIDIPSCMAASRIHSGAFETNGQVEAELRATKAPCNIVDSVSEIIWNLPAETHPSISMVSEIAGTSKRSLQRELAEEGETFRNLVAKFRFEKARRLLGETDMPLAEIAHQLGYTNDSHLVRAFRHWAGVTPGAHRRAHKLHLASLSRFEEMHQIA